MGQKFRGLDWSELFKAKDVPPIDDLSSYEDFDDYACLVQLDWVPEIKTFLNAYLDYNFKIGAQGARNGLTEKFAKQIIDHNNKEEIVKWFRMIGGSFWH